MEKNQQNSNLSKTKPAFRTSGIHTGNFGHNKVKGGSQLNEIPANQRESLGSFPSFAEHEQRLERALAECNDRKLHHFLVRELQKLRAKRGGGQRIQSPVGPHCSLENHFIDNSH